MQVYFASQYLYYFYVDLKKAESDIKYVHGPDWTPCLRFQNPSKKSLNSKALESSKYNETRAFNKV